MQMGQTQSLQHVAGWPSPSLDQWLVPRVEHLELLHELVSLKADTAREYHEGRSLHTELYQNIQQATAVDIIPLAKSLLASSKTSVSLLLAGFNMSSRFSVNKQTKKKHSQESACTLNIKMFH